MENGAYFTLATENKKKEIKNLHGNGDN